MKIALRMVGIATTIIWLMLALFIVTAVYSATLLEVNFEEPRFFVSEDYAFVIALPIKINNKGYYALEDFTLETEILYENATKILSQKTYVESIPARKQSLILHNITFDMNSLTPDLLRLLFEDTNLMVINRVSLNFTSLFPIKLYTNMTFPWGAPLYNFTVSDFSLQQHNSTHFHVSFYVSFQNHAFFNLTGRININVFDENDSLTNELDYSLHVPSGSGYSDVFDFYFETTKFPSEGRIEVVVESDMFTFGPWVIPFG